jgi:hypothetical protein
VLKKLHSIIKKGVMYVFFTLGMIYTIYYPILLFKTLVDDRIPLGLQEMKFGKKSKYCFAYIVSEMYIIKYFVLIYEYELLRGDEKQV